MEKTKNRKRTQTKTQQKEKWPQMAKTKNLSASLPASAVFWGRPKNAA